MSAGPDPIDPDEVFDVEADFGSYGLIVSLICIAALGAWFVVSLLLSALRAPEWVSTLVIVLLCTIPYAAFFRWTWDKPAIRMPGGKVPRRRRARRLALQLWVVMFVVILVRIVTA
ncbi:hypothetical protein [Sphingomonas sp.]|uniref:hypothetical protein n=1 Tax=Sphingomonas sp. TaxID=28214 RepID=UPI001B2B860C|nr:hypothetical protein [Sphingomonas sp.]MBO9713168.1 hypothetical protein [Sphingomonas sp.]